MPPNTVYVGRPTRYGNPFNWRDCPKDAGPPEWAKGVAVDLFKEWIQKKEQAWLRADIKANLKGKNLASWSAEKDPCHADVVLRIANDEERTEGSHDKVIDDQKTNSEKDD